MSDKPVCATCRNWQGTPNQYAAPCALGAFPGRTTFDQTCKAHTPHPAPVSGGRG